MKQRMREWPPRRFALVLGSGIALLVGFTLAQDAIPLSGTRSDFVECPPTDTDASCKPTLTDQLLGDSTATRWREVYVRESRPVGDVATVVLRVLKVITALALVFLTFAWLTGAQQVVAIATLHPLQVALLWVVESVGTVILAVADLVPPFQDASWEDVPQAVPLVLLLSWVVLFLVTWLWASRRPR